jgi:hypothetical protein
MKKLSDNKLLHYSLFIIPITLAAIFLVLFIKSNSELNQLKTEYDSSIENYKRETDSLKAQNKMLSRKIENDTRNNISLYSYEIEKLKQKGLYDPIKEIISDLTEHPELIPAKGILGGTMRFFESEIYILNNKWVFAYFEDGHIGGYMLLEYNVSDNGEITWNKITDMMN